MPKVAVVGCCHGELNKIYTSLANSSVDLLIICGDFQAIRNSTDLQTISVPEKYKRLGDFHEYYSGKRKAPVLTIFIGGNHECSSYLKELKYGGFVAPNIFYLGEFGSVYYQGLRITGESGIWNEHSFMQRNSDAIDSTLPYDNSSLRSIYHVKAKTFLKSYLMHDEGDRCIDISLSHDWPQGIVHYGNLPQLLRFKPFFKQDIESGRLGNPLARILLKRLRPRHWFSGHLHARFVAQVQHDQNSRSSSKKRTGSTVLDERAPAQKKAQVDAKNKEEIELDMDDDEEEEEAGDSQVESVDENNGPLQAASTNKEEVTLDMDEDVASNADEAAQEVHYIPKYTQFLALDKCVSKRKFIEFVNIKPEEKDTFASSSSLYYDRRAIAINKVIEKFARNQEAWESITKDEFLNIDTTLQSLVDELSGEVNFELKKLNELPDDDFIVDPESFKTVAPTEDGEKVPLKFWENNQTQDYRKKFLNEIV